MEYLDPALVDTFRAGIAHPSCWWGVHKILHSYGCDDLATPDGCGAMVKELCDCIGVRLTPEQYDCCVNWLMAQGIDPDNPMHQTRMWGIVNGYW